MTTTNKPTDAAGEAFEAAVRKVQDMIHAQQNWITDDIRSAADALVAERVKAYRERILIQFGHMQMVATTHAHGSRDMILSSDAVAILNAELAAIEAKEPTS